MCGVRGQENGGGSIAQQLPGGVEVDSRGFAHFAASGPHLAQAVLDGQGAASLPAKMANLGTGTALGKAAYCERHVSDEPCCHSTSKIGQAGLGHVVIESVGGDGGPQKALKPRKMFQRCWSAILP